MGDFVSKILNVFSGLKDKRILMVGLDAAGKTTILYKMKLGENVSSVPTIGFNVETLSYKTVKFTIWDVGGQDKIRMLWKHYFQNTDALIYVIDSSDKERIMLAKEELWKIINDEELRQAPILVLANKQDTGVMNVSEITETLELHKLRGQDWVVQGCCALNGEGLYEGFDWMCKNLKKKN